MLHNGKVVYLDFYVFTQIVIFSVQATFPDISAQKLFQTQVITENN